MQNPCYPLLILSWHRTPDIRVFSYPPLLIVKLHSAVGEVLWQAFALLFSVRELILVPQQLSDNTAVLSILANTFVFVVNKSLLDIPDVIVYYLPCKLKLLLVVVAVCGKILYEFVVIVCLTDSPCYLRGMGVSVRSPAVRTLLNGKEISLRPHKAFCAQSSKNTPHLHGFSH